jgi:hypothetical protein
LHSFSQFDNRRRRFLVQPQLRSNDSDKRFQRLKPW